MSDKLEEMLDPWELKNVIFLNGLHRLLQGETGSEDDPVGLLQSLDFLLRKLVAFQTDGVETVKLRPVSSGHRIGRNVLAHAGYPTDHRMSTNPAELMDRNQSANNRMIFDENVSSQGCHIGHDHIIPNLTVVGDMGVGHDKILISKNGFSAPFDRSSMEGDILPYDIMIPNLQEGGLSPVSKGLGRFSDGAKLIDLTFLSNLSPLPDDHMGSDPRPLTNGNTLFNHRVRTDFNSLTDFCFRIHDRSGMDHFFSPNMAKSSASATNFRSTTAFPL